MSGDTHVRKRGADKRRKKVEEVVEEPVPLLIPASEENIHVHKDVHLGGNFCSKIVFFCLFGTLAVLVGLLIIEFQGSGDVESATDSPWSVMLEGWVDDQHDAHEHEEHSSPADHSGEEGEEESERELEFSHYGESESELEEEDKSHENEEEGESDDKENEARERENFGFYKSLYESIYSSKDDDGGEGKEDETNSAEQLDGKVVKGDSDEGADDDDGNAEDDDDENAEDDDDENAEDDDENAGNDDESVEADNDDNTEDKDNDEEGGSEQEDVDDIFGEKNDDDYYGNNNELDADDLNEDRGDKNDDEETESNSNHHSYKKANFRDANDDIDEDDNDKDADKDDEIIKRILTKSYEKKHRFENSREKADETEAEEHIRNVMNGLRKKKLEEDVSQEIVDEEPLEGVEEKDPSEESEGELKEETAEEQEIDDDDNQETVGVILKFGVGVALIVVAHVVLIKKWNSWDSGSSVDDSQTARQEENSPDEVQLADRRESLVDEDATLPTPSGSEDEMEEESQHTGETTPEESEDEPAPERYSSKAYAQLSETPPESEGESNVGSSDGDREAEIPTHRWENEEVEGETGTEEEEEGTEDEEEAEEIEPSEDEEPPPPPPPPQPTAYARRRGGPRSSDVEFEEEYYKYSDVSNEYDWAIRNELDFAEEELLNGSVENAKLLFSEILKKHPNSVRAGYGVAKCFDQMAENFKSNNHLLQAIDAYSHTLEMPNITDKLYLQLVNRTMERMRFKGLYERLILLHGNVVRRFPNEPIHRNQMAITFLLTNRLNDARTVLENILNRWPTDGMAAAHYGFILKLENNLVEGVKYLKAGIDSNHSGAEDSRFYFHLGDALLRLGRKDEALQIHESGVAKGMFRSVYQRSLYNVDRLSARPWWNLEETTYQEFFSKLEENWKIIRKEALAVLKKQTEFLDEAENLRDVGDWKQFELFARGRKNSANCQKAPVTCGIVSIFEPASSCTRGQVKFSAMLPGTHVWPHCGPTNCRLRAHLGLVVPPETYLRVAKETRSWEEGKVLVFDDSFEHEVWHNGSSLRLVLIVDTWHPELSILEKRSLTPI